MIEKRQFCKGAFTEKEPKPKLAVSCIRWLQKFLHVKNIMSHARSCLCCFR